LKFNPYQIASFKIGVIAGYYYQTDKRSYPENEIQLGIQGEYLFTLNKFNFGINNGIVYFDTVHIIFGVSLGHTLADSSF